jgi:hypothetical protein
VSRVADPPRTAGAREIAALREKYERIVALRDAQSRGRRQDVAPPAPRAELAALADRFPGALRELDELPAEVVLARLHALDDAAADPSRAEPWMLAQSLFHENARGALAAKRWLARRRDVDADLSRAFVRAMEEHRHGAEARAWADDLADVARPPDGRIVSLVFARVARLLGSEPHEVRALVFGKKTR